MLKVKQYTNAQGERVRGIEASLSDIGPWLPVVTQVRDAILRGRIVGGNMLESLLPPAVMRLAPTQREVDAIAESAEEAVRAGRLIDFGRWTNDIIKHGGNRGGPLYTRGAIGHPFSQPYVFMHTWEDATSVYLANPQDPDKLAGGDCECVELQPARVANETVLMISDRILLTPEMNIATNDYRKYHCSCVPSIWRFLPGVEEINNGMPQANAAAGNVLDPLMTALLILSTRGIERGTVSVSAKLQKARTKNGKPPIPPYDVVQSAPYITAIQARLARRGRSEPRGGHHASPIPHLRMGHLRTLATGVKTFIRDSLVNMTPEAKQAWMSGRSHYVVKS